MGQGQISVVTQNHSIVKIDLCACRYDFYNNLFDLDDESTMTLSPLQLW